MTTEYAKPSVGTAGTGHTFPCARYPFGTLHPQPRYADARLGGGAPAIRPRTGIFWASPTITFPAPAARAPGQYSAHAGGRSSRACLAAARSGSAALFAAEMITPGDYRVVLGGEKTEAKIIAESDGHHPAGWLPPLHVPGLGRVPRLLRPAPRHGQRRARVRPDGGKLTA